MTQKKEVEEKLAASLTAETTELLPYLPYLLQDIWELGSNPADIVKLVKAHIMITAETKVIDLACGKGAVSVALAKELGLTVRGVDILPDFIAEAERKAAQFGQSERCTFAVEDIHNSVATARGYDLAVLGAVGDVLGDPAETLQKLKQVVREQGYIIIDDGYLAGNMEDVKYQNYEYLTTKQWNTLFEKEQLELIAVVDNETNRDEQINDYNNSWIQKRAAELIEKYPQHREMFEGYVQSQLDECSDLEETVIGATWLLRKK